MNFVYLISDKWEAVDRGLMEDSRRINFYADGVAIGCRRFNKSVLMKVISKLRRYPFGWFNVFIKRDCNGHYCYKKRYVSIPERETRLKVRYGFVNVYILLQTKCQWHTYPSWVTQENFHFKRKVFKEMKKAIETHESTWPL